MSNSFKNKKIVCLGGGIGTANLIKGLSKYTKNITVVVSTADDGGSAGRLRRLYNILPPGDLVSCMAAVCDSKDQIFSDLLTYRFPGDRYGKDNELPGHKLGNLIMVSLCNLTGSFEKAIPIFQKIFNIPGVFLPVTLGKANISAKTADGKIIYGEEKIDLGKYNGKRILEKVFLHPKNIKATPQVLEQLKKADIIIAGPGDLYTTVLPILIVPEIAEIILKLNLPKIFVVNVANKPFETKGYNVNDYIKAIKKHLGKFPFNKIIINNNLSIKIPSKYHYQYVQDDSSKSNKIAIIKRDVLDNNFPLYHYPEKLAKAIIENI